MIWNPRGSVWHRWDPHLHAPGTLFADQFGGDWEAYLAAVEKSDPPITALGVTDYFCIQTYKEVRKRKDGGRLPVVEFIFPNIEMRLEIKTAKNHGINLHLLFSPEDPQHEAQIERILGRLHFRFRERDYGCNRQELIALGRAFDVKQTDEGGAHKTGANLFKVRFPELQKLFREEHKWLSKNCLVAVAGSVNDGTAGLQEHASFAALRQEVERFADIIFASTPSQRDFWLGKSAKADRKTIEEKYRAIKPCMHGSDAHWVDRVGTPVEKCSVLDGYSRSIVHWDLRGSMRETDIEVILERGKEKYPEAKPRIISDNGPQFIARDFKEFIRISGMTHVRTSPYYPQSNGKIERWHKSLKSECIRPGTPLSLNDARRLVQGYVEYYNNIRLNSAIGYVTPRDMLAGRQQVIHTERDRKLAAARQQRRVRRQQVA